MTPYGIFGLCILAVLATVILALAGRRRSRPGPDMKAGEPAVLDRMREHVERHTISGRRPARASTKPAVFLTPRQLERVNIQRKLRGGLPLTRRGFSAAVANAGPARQSTSTSDWLAYLILYECLLDGHTTARVSMDTGLRILPDEPFNGHGGDFGGAGASGQWTGSDASTAAAAAAIASGAAVLTDTGFERAPPSFDNHGIESSPTPNPTFNPGPDPTANPASSGTDQAAPSPSYSPDPSPSFDSGSSSSYDSGSSSSFDSSSGF